MARKKMTEREADELAKAKEAERQYYAEQQRQAVKGSRKGTRKAGEAAATPPGPRPQAAQHAEEARPPGEDVQARAPTGLPDDLANSNPEPDPEPQRPRQPEAQPGPADESGKESLPPPQPEPGPELELVEEDAGSSEDVAPRQWTEADREGFRQANADVDEGQLKMAKALRLIRRTGWWKQVVDDQGNQVYRRFDDWCLAEKGITRQRCTQLTNWATAVETAKRLGIPVQLSPHAAQSLVPERVRQAGGLRAVLEECRRRFDKFTGKNLSLTVNALANWARLSALPEGDADKPQVQGYDEYLEDLAEAMEVLGDPHESGKFDLVRQAKRQAQEEGVPVGDVLLKRAEEEDVLPRANDLLTVATGEDLKELLGELAAAKQRIDARSALAFRLQQQEKKVSQMHNPEGLKDELKILKDLRDQADKLGVRRKGKRQDKKENADQEDEQEEEQEEEEEKVEEVLITVQGRIRYPLGEPLSPSEVLARFGDEEADRGWTLHVLKVQIEDDKGPHKEYEDHEAQVIDVGYVEDEAADKDEE
jgi:hypothetical protein